MDTVSYRCEEWAQDLPERAGCPSLCPTHPRLPAQMGLCPQRKDGPGLPPRGRSCHAAAAEVGVLITAVHDPVCETCIWLCCRPEGKRPINVQSAEKDYHTSTESLEASATKEFLASQDPELPAQRLEAAV